MDANTPRPWLGGLTASDFLRDYWHKRPLLIRGAVDVAQPFVDRRMLETEFKDLQRLLKPEKLTVYARYVRRGGLDINPYRSTEAVQLPNQRLVRQ